MRKHSAKRGLPKMTAILGVKPILPTYKVGGWQKVKASPKVCKSKGCGKLFYGKGDICAECQKAARVAFKDLLVIAYV